MHLPLTFALFGALTSVLLLLRLGWVRLPHGLQRGLVLAAVGGLLFTPLCVRTGWSSTSDALNGLVYWWFLASYEWLLLLFTILRPRWLTGLLAFALMVPILSASAFLPLTSLFDRRAAAPVQIGRDLYSQLTTFTNAAGSYSGSDLEIFYRPRWFPVLQRRRQGARYYNTQCDARVAYAVLQADGQHVQMNCPAVAGEPESAQSLVVTLY